MEFCLIFLVTKIKQHLKISFKLSDSGIEISQPGQNNVRVTHRVRIREGENYPMYTLWLGTATARNFLQLINQLRAKSQMTLPLLLLI